MTEMIRTPVSRGFYSFNRRKLNEDIKNMFETVEDTNIKPKGVIVPHAGYRYSGRTAAYAYKALKNKEIKNAIILGFNHSGSGEKAAISTKTWKTPLGAVKVNSDISEKLLENELFKEDEIAHEREHSIEVQLPFLQYIYPNIKIVPISLSKEMRVEDIKSISKTLRDIDYEENILIASSDLLHVGYQFDLTPKEDNLKYLQREEEKFINKIKEMNVQEIINFGLKTTICGYIPIATTIETLKDQISKIKILNKSNSYEVTRDKSSIVGYVSIALF